MDKTDLTSAKEPSRRGLRPLLLAVGAVLIPVLVVVAVNTTRQGRTPGRAGADGASPVPRPGAGTCAFLSEADVTAAANQPATLRPSDAGPLPRCEWIVGGRITEQVAVQFLDPTAPVSPSPGTEAVPGPWASGDWDDGRRTLLVRDRGLDFSVQVSGALVANAKQLSTNLASRIVERS